MSKAFVNLLYNKIININLDDKAVEAEKELERTRERAEVEIMNIFKTSISIISFIVIM